MLALFGTGIVCILLAISAFQHRDNPAAIWQIAGCALYLVSLLVTIMYHIPRNEQLMGVDPNSAGAPATWTHFITSWMTWNHVRTLASVGGTVCLTLALRAT